LEPPKKKSERLGSAKKIIVVEKIKSNKKRREPGNKGAVIQKERESEGNPR